MKVVISGFYGLGNTGDEAILESIVDNLREELDNPDITVFSLSPQETASTHNVKSVYRGWRHENKEKIRALRQADLLISGGGGLLQDTYPTKVIFGPLPYYLLIVFLAKLCGAKVMFFSQGIGPVNTRYGKLLMKVFANLADLITVRDEYSKQLLHKLGVKRPKSIVTSDIVFGFMPKEDKACLESLPLAEEDMNRVVAVSVRPWFGRTEHYAEMAETLDKLLEKKDVIPVFVPMEGHHDVKASNLVIERMKHSDKVHVLAGDFTPNQYLDFIGRSRLTIGMRLHSLIFATLKGVPHIGISYDKKVESLLKRSGMWDYSFLLEEIDTNKMADNAIHLLENRDAASALITENAKELRSEAVRNVDLLREYFGN
ncbi:polysaccharide pyruvyl transferase CsaB [Fictibacillus aquaticus]|uniref:Polysaccharide pyruvyl transferase CsaB n=1 Tax=Fictibacillus aquaticus TaxID=2021314 RepID=A0A235FFQ8_9BACL|nr:polysaccharide pyruvyl transferase CsaB [Fictibacillus aquaticus]OYD59767.1 polysaccharide pyruvyl transferase CsaB [Fictibacillus aquaticus]